MWGPPVRRSRLMSAAFRVFPGLEPAKLEPVLFGKAVALQLQKRFLEAAELYRRVLEKNPGNEEALANSIAVNLELKEYAAAARDAEQLLKLQPESGVAREGLATAAF